MSFTTGQVLTAAELNALAPSAIALLTGPAGAYGDGASHQAGGVYQNLTALQTAYPFATSLSQEIDFLAWQAALNAGGPIYSKARHYVMCNATPASFAAPLTMIAGQSWIEGHGCVLDFSGMQTQPQNTHLVTNYNFATSSAWSNATIYGVGGVTAMVFGSGMATAADPQAFIQFGQLLTLPPGKYTVSVSYSVVLNSNFHTGNVTPPWGNLAWFANSPGDGTNSTIITFPGMVGVVTSGAVPLNFTLTSDFQLTTSKTAWLTFTAGGYGDFTVTKIDIQPWYPNCALLLTRDGAVEHYPIPQPIRGVEIIGNSRLGLADPLTPIGATAVLYQSFANQDGNLVSLQDCAIHGWGTGFELKDGAFLTEWRNVELYDNDICLNFHNHGVNSGENFRLYGGGVSNSTVGISNPAGAEFTLYGTALDYCGKAIANNGGRIELHSVHVEQQLINSPIFHCSTGIITMFGGMILMVGSVGSQATAPIQLDTSLSLMQTFGTQIFGVTNQTGFSSSGVGTFRNFGWVNAGNPLIGTPAGQVNDVLGGMGNLEPPASGVWVGADPTGIFLEGGIYGVGETGVTNRWTTDHLTMGFSTAQHHSGTRSLIVTKAGIGGGSADYQLVLLLPVRPGQDASLNFWYIAPGVVTAPLSVTSITSSGLVATVTTASPHGLSAGFSKVVISGATPAGYNGAVFVATTPTTTTFTYSLGSTLTSPATGTILMAYTAVMFARTWWAKVIGYDSHARPLFSQANSFKGENDIFFDTSGATGWQQYGAGTQFSPPVTTDTGQGPGAPAWATHFALLFDTQSLPAMSFYMDDFTASII